MTILGVGDTWNIDGTWSITANSIDATSKQVWLTLSKDRKDFEDSRKDVIENIRKSLRKFSILGTHIKNIP